MRKSILLSLVVSTIASASVRFEEVTSAIAKSQSMEQLLPLLPKELRSNFTFIYKSRGPHGGLGDSTKSAVDKLHPRVVLFSNDGKMTLAFTGNPTKPGYDSLEMIRYIDKDARFEMSHYALNDPTNKENGVANPASCLRCHGQDPRPISDSYPLWPGFYGSVRDTFPKGSPEGKWYRAFLRKHKNAKTGVYRHLDWPKGTSVPPYLDPKQYDPNSTEGEVDKMKLLPNTRLGMAWTELNRKRILRKLKASPLYSKMRYGILSGYLGCRNLPVEEGAILRTYANLEVENKDRIRRLGLNPQGPNDTSLDMMELGFYLNVVQLEYLAEALKVDRSDWSLAFEKNSLSFFDGILSSIQDDTDFYLKEDMILELLRDLSTEDPAFLPYFKPYSAYADYGYEFGERLDLGTAMKACELLKTREKELQVTLPIFDVEKKKSAHQTAAQLLKTLNISTVPFQRCTECHEGEEAVEIGRKIPFRSPAQLKVELKKAASGGRPLLEEILSRVESHSIGHMPPYGEPLAPSEVENLKRYLTAVADS